MKITPDDPALTAYALGELDASEAHAISEALKNDEALSREVELTSALGGLLSQSLGDEALTLGEDRVAEIMKAGQRPDAEVLVMEHRKRSRRQSVMAFVGVAAVVTLGFVGLSKFNISGKLDSGSSSTDAASSGSGSGSGNGLGSGPGTGLGDGSGQDVVESASVDLSQIEMSLTNSQTLPSRDSFQVNSWVQMTPVTVDPQLRLGRVCVYAELGACSWNEDHALLLVNLQTEEGTRAWSNTTLNFSDRVVSALALSDAGQDLAKPIQSGGFGGAMTFLYEVELSQEEGPIGALRLNVQEQPAGYLPLAGRVTSEEALSTDFETVRLLARYAKWGSSQDRDTNELAEMDKKARELLTSVTDEKSRYALDMILLSEELIGSE